MTMRTTTRWTAALGTGLALTLGTLTPAAAAPDGASARPAAAGAGAVAAAPTALQVHLPAGWARRLDAVSARTGVHSPTTEALQQALDPGDYECAPTRLTTYVDRLLRGLDRSELEFLLLSGALLLPAFEALLIGAPGDPRFALPEEYAESQRRAFEDLREFWDVPSADIQLLAMRGGGVLADPARLTRLLVEVFGLSRPEASRYARFVVDGVAAIPELRAGRNPIFTLNAVAYTGEGNPDPFFSSIPDRIVMGEGLFRFFEYLGDDRVGAQVVLAHEFGHHVQFERGVFDDALFEPEATRRTELMADALATYFGAHKRGLSLNAKRVAAAEQAFYVVGDCDFDSPGHHGTPAQRARAAEWGAVLADARPRGHVLPSAAVIRRFDAALPRLVAPDAR